MNKSESKYFRTAVLMDQALLSLLEKKDFAYITVKEICEKAGVNRSTFYLHYETAVDLLEESIDYMQGQFMSGFEQNERNANFVRRIHQCPRDELMLITPEYLTPYLEFVRQNRRLYRAVMDNPRIFRADEVYRKMFEHIFDPILARFGVEPTERKYRMAFYINGISAIVSEWLKQDCAEPVERIAEIIQRCVPSNESDR